MATDLSSPGSLIAWANSLKEKIGQEDVADRGETPEPQIPDQLRSDLLEVIELLINEVTQGDTLGSKDLNPGNDTGADAVADQIASILDDSLAQWQASVSNGFAQAVVQEMDGQLKIAERLNADLREQEKRLAHQLAACQDQQASNLRQQAKLARQRKSVAKSLRARKAQMLLEIEQLRATSLSDARLTAELEIRSEVESELERLQATLRNQEEQSAATEKQLAEARRELADLPERLQESNAGWQELSAKSNERNEQLQSELKIAKEQLRLESANLESALCDTDKHQQRELDNLCAELNAARTTLEDERSHFESELEAAEAKLRKERDSRKEENANASEIIELKEQLELAHIEIEDLSAAKEQLSTSAVELTELRERCTELEEASDALLEDEGVIERVRKANEELQEEVDALQSELDQAKLALTQQPTSENSEISSAEVEELQQLLDDTETELDDLKSQNADLASQLARQQIANSSNKPHVQFDQESLSWEERKILILQQLENESIPDEPEEEPAQVRRLEIEEVLNSTQLEVEKRDREIQELRSIIEHQSDTKQGVAIGAAAIAQVFDADELIAQEREKLKGIQQEWEEKLRQAEIDLSMENAKLARERMQLDSELEDARSMQDSPRTTEGGGKGKTRKWLDHLGLRDENQKKSS